VFAATSQIAPDKVDAFLRIAREEIAKMAREPVPRDEFERALNPGIAGIERSRKTNGYWMTNIAAWTRRPEMIEQTRNHLSGYKAVTPDAVRAAMAAYVADDGDWSMIVLPEKKANGD
jgi:zinc protease